MPRPRLPCCSSGAFGSYVTTGAAKTAPVIASCAVRSSSASRRCRACSKATGRISHGEIFALDRAVGLELGHLAVVADLAFFEYVSAIAHELGEVQVLLAQQHAQALLLERDDRVRHVFDDAR